MIVFLNGKLAHKDPAFVVIECGGVGYQSSNLVEYLFQDRECGGGQIAYASGYQGSPHELYAFSDLKEKGLFIQLISIQGVGGNTAMTILSSIDPKELFQVIETENLNRLKQVKGIGAKTASRIILELKGKLVMDGAASAANPANKLREDAISALVSLGMPKAAMETRVDAILKAAGAETPTIEKVIKDALKG